ncbi:MAG: hypothetical protein GQ564_09240 [Bacteroidales bacterium]|nr:hypothetical protein [Bacteroidales bacterium]
MRILVSILVFILVAGIPETMSFSPMHSENSGELNLRTLDKIESLIHKKVETDHTTNHKKSFSLNGHNFYTEVVEHRFGANIYKESFYEVQNPNNEFRIRLVINPNGNQELAVMIQGDEGFKNYHACFDPDGIMIEDDPWGKDKGNYTIEIFDLYKKYIEIYAQKIDEINIKQQESKNYISGQF